MLSDESLILLTLTEYFDLTLFGISVSQSKTLVSKRKRQEADSLEAQSLEIN